MPSATPESSPPRIVLGVAGGIAAYKSVELLRLLRDANYYVTPILTPDATRFVGALTFSALASEPARTSLFGDPTTPIPHTYLGQNADLVVVAPATAHLIARYATGLADDLLSATLAGDEGPGTAVRGDALRDVGAALGAGEPRHAATSRGHGPGTRDRTPRGRRRGRRSNGRTGRNLRTRGARSCAATAVR